MLKIWFKPSNTIELINCNDQNFLKKLARIFFFSEQHNMSNLQSCRTVGTPCTEKKE